MYIYLVLHKFKPRLLICNVTCKFNVCILYNNRTLRIVFSYIFQNNETAVSISGTTEIV